MRIKPVEYESASKEVKNLWDEHEKEHIMTNMKRTLLREPDCFKVMMEWYYLYDKVAEVTGTFAADVFAHAISSENDCLVCSTFFRKILIDNGRDPDNLVLDETEQLLADYGRACVKQPVRVNNELFERMRRRFSDEQIVLLTTFAGMMIATNLINHALAVELDTRLLGYEKKEK